MKIKLLLSLVDFIIQFERKHFEDRKSDRSDWLELKWKDNRYLVGLKERSFLVVWYPGNDRLDGERS